MTDLPAYASGLFVTVAFAFITGLRHKEAREQLWRVAGVLLTAWCLGVLWVTNTGDYTPWQFNIVLDSLCAFAVMYHPAGRAQAYVGLFFMLQIAWHIGYGARILFGHIADPIFYYDMISLIAWAQLAAVGIWGGGRWGQGFLRRVRDRHDAMDRRKGSIPAGEAK